jgi:2,3-dihydroxy-p-cumate/2,3-dihydroxybenzoate 3,4-dioxygenase
MSPEVDTPNKPFEATHTKIQRLGHVVFSTPRSKETTAFFRDVLNFRVSDSIGENLTFMRPFPSPFHHGIGIARGTRPLFHHLNFMVTEIDDIGRALNRLKRGSVQIVYGPGRHPPSGSIFLYFLDPDGITLEYSFGMEEFRETDARGPRFLMPAPESVDTWGSARDPRFATVGEMEVARIGQISS